MNKNIFLIIIITFLSADCMIGASQTEKKSVKDTENIEDLNANLACEARRGRLAEVERLLQQGANPDGFKDGFRRTVLNSIAQIENNKIYKEIANTLIDKGADVNLEGAYGYSVLGDSIIRNYKNVPYDFLINKGANINFQNNKGNTLLMEHLRHIMGCKKLRDRSISKELLKDLPRVVNIVLFKTNLEYNLDLVNKEGHNVDYYVNQLPENTKKWVKKAIKKFKELKARKKACINEYLQKGNVIPDLCNIVHEYLDGNGNIVKDTELKEKEE